MSLRDHHLINHAALTIICCLCLTFLTLLCSSAQGLELKSPAFTSGSMIPSVYTCEEKDISPPLTWSGVPPDTKSFVLICDDPDAPLSTWVHWVYYNIPASLTSLPKDVEKTERPALGGIQGINSFGDLGYGGPCPPQGTHRYIFKLYALDIMLKLPTGAKKVDVLKAMDGHVLAHAELVGRYKKR